MTGTKKVLDSVCAGQHRKRRRLAVTFVTLLLAAAATPGVAQSQPFDLGVTVKAPATAKSGENVVVDISVTNYWSTPYPVGAPVTIQARGGLVPGEAAIVKAVWVSNSMSGPCAINIGVFCQEPLQNAWSVGQTRKLRLFATITVPPPLPGAKKFVQFCARHLWAAPWIDQSDQGLSRNDHCQDVEIVAPLDVTDYDLGVTNVGPATVVQNGHADFVISIFNRHTQVLKAGTPIEVSDTWAGSKLQFVAAHWATQKITGGLCAQNSGMPVFVCTGTLNTALLPGDMIAVKARFTALAPAAAKNCAKLQPIQGMNDLSNLANKRNAHCADITIVP